MPPTEIIIILALTGYAIYQQTRRHETVQQRALRQ